MLVPVVDAYLLEESKRPLTYTCTFEIEYVAENVVCPAVAINECRRYTGGTWPVELKERPAIVPVVVRRDEPDCTISSCSEPSREMAIGRLGIWTFATFQSLNAKIGQALFGFQRFNSRFKAFDAVLLFLNDF